MKFLFFVNKDERSLSSSFYLKFSTVKKIMTYSLYQKYFFKKINSANIKFDINIELKFFEFLSTQLNM